MKKIRRSCANMDTITTNNQWYENNFVCILEERYNPEEVEKLLDGESIVDENGNEEFIHEEENGDLSVTFSFEDENGNPILPTDEELGLTLGDDDVIIIQKEGAT